MLLFYLSLGSDWPLYIGLTVVGAICVALGAGLARGARKRSLPPYSIARTGKANINKIPDLFELLCNFE